jgi:hypothetical protein
MEVGYNIHLIIVACPLCFLIVLKSYYAIFYGHYEPVTVIIGLQTKQNEPVRDIYRADIVV